MPEKLPLLQKEVLSRIPPIWTRSYRPPIK